MANGVFLSLSYRHRLLLLASRIHGFPIQGGEKDTKYSVVRKKARKPLLATEAGAERCLCTGSSANAHGRPIKDDETERETKSVFRAAMVAVWWD